MCACPLHFLQNLNLEIAIFCPKQDSESSFIHGVKLDIFLVADEHWAMYFGALILILNGLVKGEF